MKIKLKLAILEEDVCYLNRIVTAFSTKFAEDLEIYSFTNLDLAMEALDTNRIDVLLASDAFHIDVEKLPKRCGFAYFVDSSNVSEIDEQRAVCKFQMADLIYKQILSIYAENAGRLAGFKAGDDKTRVIVFSSPCGGNGNSCVAAACAQHFANARKKVLYLNLERFGSSDLFFRADGSFTMSDIIYAIKGHKANLALKLQSCIKQDEQGVYFFSVSRFALDMMELTCKEIQQLIDELRLTGSFDYIIVDTDFSLDAEIRDLYRQAHGLVWVGDCSSSSNLKIQRAFEALQILEEKQDSPLTERVALIYNRVSSHSSRTVGNIGIREIGGAPVYRGAEPAQIVRQIATDTMFDSILPR